MRLEEYLERYPEDQNSVEARFLLAKALEQRSRALREMSELVGTEHIRREFQDEVQALLKQAADEFRRLRSNLLVLDETDFLDPLGQRILRDCYFEVAQTYYMLGDFSNSIVLYSIATNRYPRDSQILLAYMQMADCYDRLGKPAEAQSMLKQAKVLLRQMSDGFFEPTSTNMDRDEWEDWIDWVDRLRPIANRQSNIGMVQQAGLTARQPSPQ